MLAKAQSAQDFLAFREKQQITHLMIDEDLTLTPGTLDDRERGLLREFLERYIEIVARGARRSSQTLRRLILDSDRATPIE